MSGERALFIVAVFASGFVSAVMVGARNGDQMADREIGMLEACDELARFDRADCMQRLDTMGEALHALPRRPSFTGKGSDATTYAWFGWQAGVAEKVGTFEILPEGADHV